MTNYSEKNNNSKKKAKNKHLCYFIFEQPLCYLLVFKHLAKLNIQLILVHFLKLLIFNYFV